MSAQALSAFGAAFLASFVEWVEAFSVLLAASIVGGWRASLAGAAAAGALLVVLILIFGAALGEIPIAWLRLGVGLFTGLFGLRWLAKSILRLGGVAASRDEEKVFAVETAALTGRARAGDGSAARLSALASFKATLLEGVEVAIIVIALGAQPGALGPAALGASAALLLVALIGAAVRKPLARAPEDLIKFAVGAMLSAFGAFWTAEGLGGEWPFGDAILPVLILGFAALAGLLVAWVRGVAGAGSRAAAP